MPSYNGTTACRAAYFKMQLETYLQGRKTERMSESTMISCKYGTHIPFIAFHVSLAFFFLTFSKMTDAQQIKKHVNAGRTPHFDDLNYRHTLMI